MATAPLNKVDVKRASSANLIDKVFLFIVQAHAQESAIMIDFMETGIQPQPSVMGPDWEIPQLTTIHSYGKIFLPWFSGDDSILSLGEVFANGRSFHITRQHVRRS
jgi:hypothetical protein